jgi:lysophospholipase L1-like esterase
MSATDETAKSTLTVPLPSYTRYIVSGVEVASDSANAATVVALGDSITDGFLATFDADRRWPDALAERLQHAGLKDIGIVNQGISGNRLLRGGAGISALARLDRDVFSLPNVRALILLEGINDLGIPVSEGTPMPSAAEMISAYKQIANRAHARGVKVIVASLMPYKGVGPTYYSPAGEKVRAEVNDWIRSTKIFDAVVDLDRITADPKDVTRLGPAFDSGDGLHPSDRGYAGIAAAIDLTRLH